MNIIIIGSRFGQTLNLNLTSPRFVVPAVAGVLLLLTGIWFAGYVAAPNYADVVYTSSMSEEWEQDIADHRQEIAEARREFHNNVNAMAHRLGQLQAHITRLNAVGHRMTEMASLDPQEFDFDNPPALGGAEEPESVGDVSLDQLSIALDQFTRDLDERERQLQVLQELMVASRLRQQVHPSGMPVERGWMSSGFGLRRDPFSGRRSMHKGVDFVGGRSQHVISVAAGVVITSKYHNGYGNMVEVNHGNGYVTRYAHNSKNLVKVGQRVERGQRIAKIGSTGRSTGPHVHFEVFQNGKRVDPTRFIRAGL